MARTQRDKGISLAKGPVGIVGIDPAGLRRPGADLRRQRLRRRSRRRHRGGHEVARVRGQRLEQPADRGRRRPAALRLRHPLGSEGPVPDRRAGARRRVGHRDVRRRRRLRDLRRERAHGAGVGHRRRRADRARAPAAGRRRPARRAPRGRPVPARTRDAPRPHALRRLDDARTLKARPVARPGGSPGRASGVRFSEVALGGHDGELAELLRTTASAECGQRAGRQATRGCMTLHSKGGVQADSAGTPCPRDRPATTRWRMRSARGVRGRRARPRPARPAPGRSRAERQACAADRRRSSSAARSSSSASETACSSVKAPDRLIPSSQHLSTRMWLERCVTRGHGG